MGPVAAQASVSTAPGWLWGPDVVVVSGVAQALNVMCSHFFHFSPDGICPDSSLFHCACFYMNVIKSHLPSEMSLLLQLLGGFVLVMAKLDILAFPNNRYLVWPKVQGRKKP